MPNHLARVCSDFSIPAGGGLPVFISHTISDFGANDVLEWSIGAAAIGVAAEPAPAADGRMRRRAKLRSF